MGCITGLRAQEQWPLETCIQYALENNLQVKQSELNVQLSKANLTQSKGQFLPSVNASATHFYNFGRAIDPFTNQFAEDWVRSNNMNVRADWTLFNGMRNINGYKQSQYDMLANEYALESMEYDISLSITQAYLQILFNEENLRVTLSQLEQTRQQVDRTQKLVDAGGAPRGDLLDIQAQFANEELNRIDQENQLNLSYLSLKQLLQLPGNADLAVYRPSNLDTTSLRLPQSPAGIIESAYTNYPSIKSAEYSVLSAERGVAVAKSGVSPSLSLTGSIGTGYSGNNKILSDFEQGPDRPIGFVEGTNQTVFEPTFSPTSSEVTSFGDQVEDNFNRSIGFTLQVPIFNQFSTHTSISRAKIQREIANTQLEQEKQTVRQNIEQSYADALAAFKRYQSTQKSLESLQLAFDYAEKRFDVGVINAVDYNAAKNNLTRAQADLIRAKYEYIFRLKILDFYQGNPIKL